MIKSRLFEAQSFGTVFVNFVSHCLQSPLPLVILNEICCVIRSGVCLVVVNFDGPSGPLLGLTGWRCLHHRFMVAHNKGHTRGRVREASFSSIVRALIWRGLIGLWDRLRVA